MLQNELDHALSIALPEGFDPGTEFIVFAFDDADCRFGLPMPPASRRFVKVVTPLASCADWPDEEASKAWRERYGAPLPAKLSLSDSTSLSAQFMPYDGPTTLSSSEQEVIYGNDFGDLTIGMLYVMIEGLSWRPGGWASCGRKWPPKTAMLSFYHFWRDSDPEGSLMIALSVYTTGPGNEYFATYEEIAAVAAEIERMALAAADSGAFGHEL